MIADELARKYLHHHDQRSEPHPMTTPAAPKPDAIAHAAAAIAVNPLIHVLAAHGLGEHLTGEQRNTVCTLIATLEQQNHAEVQAQQPPPGNVMTAEEFRASEHPSGENGILPTEPAQPQATA